MATKKVLVVDPNIQAVDTLDKSTFKELINVLKRLIKSTEVLSTQDSNNRQRVNVETGTVAISSGTVTTVSNVNTLANVDSRFLFIDTARNAYANGIRNKIIF